MRHKLSLTGQLLALRLVIVCLVLVGVAAVSIAQTTQRAREVEGRRALAVAETLAASSGVRGSLAAGQTTFVRVAAESARTVSGSTAVLVAAADRTVIATPDPEQLGRRLDIGTSTVLSGRAWMGSLPGQTHPAAVAMVPVLDEGRQQVIGFVVVSREYPSWLDSLGEAAPNLLTYLGVASAIGAFGSVLVARRVKRQTLGLEPSEIAGLVEHRDAMLYGIKEGVLGLDLRGRVTLVNGDAVRLLGLPEEAIGRTLAELGVSEELRAALSEDATGPDRPVAVSGRVLVLNRLPISSRGRPIGSVTTLRDRTELLELQRELDSTRHVTDTLRAQAHEFTNRLHTIAGLIELGEADEAVRFVHRVSSSRSEFSATVTSCIQDPSIAALLIAKSSQAFEQGVELSIAPDTSLPEVDDDLSADVATVVGNLVDNALEAAGARSGGWVQVQIVHSDADVRIAVRDSGPGIPEGMANEVFQRGVSTKNADDVPRGIGLNLVHLICTRRGGSVTASNDGGAVFVARLPCRQVATP